MPLTELFLIFTLGLVSSLHCVQMCGPLVIAFSLPFNGQAARRQLAAQFSYHIGRIITYTLLGTIAGLLGQTVGVIGQLAGAQNLLAVVAGLLMLLAGLFRLDLLPTRQLLQFDPLRWLASVFKPVGVRIAAPTAASKFILGLTLGLLPCGLVYAALFKAMSTGTAFAGAMTMAAFGLGTAGALLALGLCSTVISRRVGNWGSRLAALSITLLGAMLIWRGMLPMFVGNTAHPAPGHLH